MTGAPPDPERRRTAWYRRARLWVPLVLLLVLAVAIRLGLEPLATWYTQRGLDRMKGFRGTFSAVTFSLVQFTYTIRDLRIVELASQGAEPLFYAKEIEAQVLWRELLHRNIVGRARVTDAKAVVVLLPGEEPKEEEAEKVQEAVQQGETTPIQLDDLLKELIPFRLNHIDVYGSELLIADAREPERPQLWFSEIEATVENFSTRTVLTDGDPTTIAVSARMQRSGHLSVFLSADPLADELSFALELRVRGLKLADLHDWVAAKTDLKLTQGVLDLFASIRCDSANLTGGVKPLLKDVEVAPDDKDLLTRLKAGLADASLDVFSDRVPGREAAAAIVPIEGRISNPNSRLWPTIVTLVRNAFVEALAAGFAGLDAEGKQ